MRAAIAVGLLFATTGLAAATDARSLPDYFATSWDAVAAAPLKAFTTPEHDAFTASWDAVTEAPLVPFAPPKAAPAAASPRDDLPPIMLAGIPVPPERPVVMPGAAAYASLGPDAASGLAGAAVIPLPLPRPRGIDQAAGQPAKDALSIRPEAAPPQPETKVAMLGGLPGAGMAIANLARMAPLPPIAKGACSVANPYKVTALGPNGRTALQPAATLDAPMVQGLVKWEGEVQAAAKQTLGEPIVALKVAASYDCRTMNHRRRARLSEHAHANAIDIAAFVTASGKEITVERDFHSRGPGGAFLKAVHADTCDVFQVVLGPGSDGMHENHFHMDLGRWKACR
ncbi:extensin-like domain-containing protein [Labrys wisconsinensis]|uniref:Extensin-like C-terminal domain-containing protein n=1 Tax=Labrys wisconsinensis TaxID=425677 RepID=A0ABU0JF70_9HYPH|nr:extensin family protein [Labrys wisconsinensis]MDQ0472925.1 hypothetical protein [Labrys wisconsinensis]